MNFKVVEGRNIIAYDVVGVCVEVSGVYLRGSLGRGVVRLVDSV